MTLNNPSNVALPSVAPSVLCVNSSFTLPSLFFLSNLTNHHLVFLLISIHYTVRAFAAKLQRGNKMKTDDAVKSCH